MGMGGLRLCFYCNSWHSVITIRHPPKYHLQQKWLLTFPHVVFKICQDAAFTPVHQDVVFSTVGWGFVQTGSVAVYYIVLCHGRHRIHHGMSIRRKMITLGMDLGCFALSKPHANQHQSIPLVTIVLLISSPWRILYI